MHKLPFRQVHLDFHTSPEIKNIGVGFDRKQWQDALRVGHVNSITCFSKCHHGWSYHPTKVGKQHPHLDFDLLREQFDTSKEAGVNVPVYLSAGFDDLAALEHPEWREVNSEGQVYPPPLKDGFRKMCFNSPYLDYLCDQIHETISLFPDCDGIFLDIIFQSPCCCKWCMDVMETHGWDVSNESDRQKCAQYAIQQYFEKTTAACKSGRADMPVFHNGGHIARGDRKKLHYFSHLELESLPTGGWGYDHFPISAKYCHKLPYDLLGMTGKFHTAWGEFGGYKHPNALRYECASMLAFGSKCSVGDQLHPEVRMDPSSYEIIGRAYAEVEAKEPWCEGCENIADIGLLSCAAANRVEQGGAYDNAADTGAGRLLLEGHFLFDVLDLEMDFSDYKMLILPDEVQVDPELNRRLDSYVDSGGKLLLTGTSGLATDGSGFVFDVGATWHGESEFCPDYILPTERLRPEFVNSPMVMYATSQRIKVGDGQSVGEVYNPYFNRTYRHYSSHQHAAARPDPSGYDCGVRKGNILYLAHPVFSMYRTVGAVACKEYVLNAIRFLLKEPTVEAGVPSAGRITFMKQPAEKRAVLHLLYANTINRGGVMKVGGAASEYLYGVEVIDEIVPLYNVEVSVRTECPVMTVTCVPERKKLEFEQSEGQISFTVPVLECHQMIELCYA